MAERKPMPEPGHHTAPVFKDSPAGVRAYFRRLEMLFDARAGLTDLERKKYAVGYLELENAEEWETITGDSLTSAEVTYAAWKELILNLYPGARNENTVSLQDIHLLVGKWANNGVYSLDELAVYYRKFISLAQNLQNRGLMNVYDQQKYFLNGLPQHLRQSIRTRLMILNPNNNSRHVYTVAQIYAAAAFVMDGGDASNDLELQPHAIQESPFPRTSFSVPPLPPVANSPTIKVEDYAAAVEAMLREKFPSLLANSSPGSSQVPVRPRSNACSFCGATGHYARACDTATRYINENKCKRDDNNRFTMLDGSNIPYGSPGETLAQRIDRRLQSTASMMSAIRTTAMVTINTPSSSPQVSVAPIPTHITQSLNASLTPVSKPTVVVPSAFIQEVASDDEDSDTELIYEALAAAANTRNRARTKKTDPPTTAPAIPQSQPPLTTTSQPPHTTTPTTLPAPTQPIVASGLPTNVRAPKDVPEFRYAAPIEEKVSAQKVLDRLLSSTVQLSAAEVIALSPDIRKLMKEATTTKKVRAVAYTSLDPQAQYKYESYNMPSGLVVAKESHSLRSVWPVIDSIGAVECIVDSGCQIVAMSEAVWLSLNKPLNPNIRLRMQSANGSVTESLGMIENVSFKFNDIELFLQAHVVRESAYDVLLGRPFDVLTESMVRNFNNDSQVITITDPNNRDISLAIPTHPRGEPRFKMPNQKGFQ